MRIVKLSEFLAMPPGTVFAKYAPEYFEELQIKGESLTGTSDFFSQSVIEIGAEDCGQYSARLQEAELYGASIEMDLDVQGRDGCFNEEQLFAVYEKQDVELLIYRLRRALEESK